MRKNYVSVYTCAVSRAVHLDTVPDLRAEAFIRNFRLFAARRRLPRELNSDILPIKELSRHSILKGPHGGVATLND